MSVPMQSTDDLAVSELQALVVELQNQVRELQDKVDELELGNKEARERNEGRDDCPPAQTRNFGPTYRG